ncbi:MAG: tRNA glutamyl-Q(34) synthetase GluQRS [Myxococcales bacterium]|nr:tRNA glutamyl-Q(34) synthetase GluQRS [Myxococcales bacterium]
MAERYRGRLAPSPTGRLHFGVARTSLLAWLRARQAGGQLILRMEDLDEPRTQAGAAQAIIDDLGWLGLDWDEGPDRGGECGPYLQSERKQLYGRALEALRRQGMVFECSCSRREVAAAASAPHGEHGPRYPGTCRARPAVQSRPRSMRFAMPEPGEPFDDLLHGPQAVSESDDFIVQRADGIYAYQLAVVVDDIAMGVTEVVRGDDLLSSTPRQLALYRALGAEPPRFLHVPLVMGPDGKRLSKRHGPVAIADYRIAGLSSEQVLGALASSLGLCEPGARVRAEMLIERLELSALSKAPSTLDGPLGELHREP